MRPLSYLGTLALLTTLIVAVIAVAVSRCATARLLADRAGSSAGADSGQRSRLSVFNWDVTHIFPAASAAAHGSVKGIPEEARTMVVVPTIFPNEAQVKNSIESSKSTSSPTRTSTFTSRCWATFADATRKRCPRQATSSTRRWIGIEELNKRYQRHGTPDRFHLFHRRRQWCESEEKWMGWERKRGKLEEFNRLLRGARTPASSFDYCRRRTAVSRFAT